MMTILEKLRGQLIVSCQAGPDEPLHGPTFMAAMARAAVQGGAAAIRANGPEDIAAIAEAVTLPIIGIFKQKQAGYDVFITPTFDAARQVVQAGARMVALDGTPRPRPDGEDLRALVTRIHAELGVPVMADISCLEDAATAEAAGADLLGTTLAGYTDYGRPPIPGPDLEFVRDLLAITSKPVVAEGRFVEPAQVVQALRLGAYAVVVGGAITRPQEITRRFVASLPAPSILEDE